MRVLLICGNHPRHIFLANILQKHKLLQSLIIEERESFVPMLDNQYSNNILKLHNLHFKKREEAELEVFGNEFMSFKNTLRIKGSEINSSVCHEFVLKENPDIVITCGCGLLSKETLNVFPIQTWNIHGGLSPWFKGAITHFWPSYFLKPQYTGVTIHYISPKIDAGNIIHQTPAHLVENDGLHQLSARSLKLGFLSIIDLINKLKKNGELNSIKQKTTGKLWLKKDWKPEHLLLIYDKFNDEIVNMYLSNQLNQELPNIYDNFNNTN
tara:strand:+ start:559 stop:1362 length:804 start_codon:yes stop_codon:yes gene_type:complete